MPGLSLHDFSLHRLLRAGFGSGKGKYEEECEVKSFEAYGTLNWPSVVCCEAQVSFAGMPELEKGDKVILPQVRSSCWPGPGSPALPKTIAGCFS